MEKSNCTNVEHLGLILKNSLITMDSQKGTDWITIRGTCKECGQPKETQLHKTQVAILLQKIIGAAQQHRMRFNIDLPSADAHSQEEFNPNIVCEPI